MKKMIVNTKRLTMVLTMTLTMAATGNAMSYEQARNEALFLTDKMAYELNLTDDQYEAAYEINLDYLMGVTSYDNVYGTYWERRNLDMSYILFDWQWQAFCAASYFYRPLYWRDGFWHFGIYARYPHRDYFYFGRPVFYASYRGGHAWHVIGGHGYYYGRRDHYRPAPVAGRSHFGMLDRWNRGDFRGGRITGTHSHFGGNRNSSTRTTVHNNGNNTPGHTNGSYRRGSLGGYRSQGSATTRPATHGNARPTAPATATPRNAVPATSEHSAATHSNGSFSNSHSTNSIPQSSLGGSRSSGSVGSGATRSSHSGGSRSTGGGHSYGGRR